MCAPELHVTHIALAAILLFTPGTALAQKPAKNQKPLPRTVWNYDGGVLFETDGSLPNGACFRVSGRLEAPTFFENLKRVDTDDGALFRRGQETVSKFPEALLVSYIIRDQPCTLGLEKIAEPVYLTEKMVETLRLSIYWKHGVDLQAVKNIKELHARVDRVAPYAAALAAELPRRYEWSFQLAVPSAGVSLSDSLVFVFRQPGDRIAARVAARM
jgi:hypothetical protein